MIIWKWNVIIKHTGIAKVMLQGFADEEKHLLQKH